MHRADPSSVGGILTLDAVDHLLTESGLRTPSVRLVHDGQILPERDYTTRATMAGTPVTGLVDTRRLLALHDGGATVVLQGLHRYWPPLIEFVGRLEAELGHPCQANAYLTPAGASGFATHSDNHDVFVVQTCGTKHWILSSQPEDGGLRELVLEPGHVLYLPTGTPHAATAQDGSSLHVTIGITQLTLREVVHRTVTAVLEAVPDRHLPVGFHERPGELAEALGVELRAVAARIRDLDPADAVDTQVYRAGSGRPSRLGGALLDRQRLPAIGQETALQRRAGHPCLLRERPGGRLAVYLGDRIIDVPGWLRSALEQVQQVDRLTPADLADHLDPESRIVLCRRLVREGLLRVAQ